MASNTTHGMHDSPGYCNWKAMVDRCTNPDAKHFLDYGGRGITVCERWLKVENFLTDMLPKPSNAHSLDRINNDGNYEPSNCRWATRKEQQRNKRNNHLVTFNGQTLCCSAWDDEIGLRRGTTSSRLNHGWSVQRALTAAAKPSLCQP